MQQGGTFKKVIMWNKQRQNNSTEPPTKNKNLRQRKDARRSRESDMNNANKSTSVGVND